MQSKFILLITVFAVFLIAACNNQHDKNKKELPVSADNLTLTPPMGWNSYDCLGLQATEAQVKKVTDYMALHLKKYGYEYIVIDAGWFDPLNYKGANAKGKHPNIDQYGRFVPDTVKFPSAKGGVGFKALANYVHKRGLKFGLHLMRGIPRYAVDQKSTIKGSKSLATDIANLQDTCDWSRLMWGINMEKPGAQEYYNSVFELFASWGIDFVKVDDISFPYNSAEIEAVHQAILNSKAPVVLSLSPGPAPVEKADDLAEKAHLWRISDDIWDDWKLLKLQFSYCKQWDSVHIAGHWPDADMLPIGKLRLKSPSVLEDGQLEALTDEMNGEYSHFTDDEKYTIMTLWSIFRSPLILGGYLPENDSFTTNLITNEEVIAVDQKSENNHEIRNSNGIVIWSADQPGTKAKYVALFNINDENSEKVSISWNEIGVEGEQNVRDLWAKKNLGKFTGEFSAIVAPHGCILIRVGQ
jgi:hypothetical protein